MVNPTFLGGAGHLGTAPRRLVGAMLSCPRCRLLIRVRVASVAPERCPRCLARNRVVVTLELQTPADSASPVQPAVAGTPPLRARSLVGNAKPSSSPILPPPLDV
jgi:hypothetical protein